MTDIIKRLRGERDAYKKDAELLAEKLVAVMFDNEVASLRAEIERLRAVIGQAVKELDSEHRKIRDADGCVVCWRRWPCVSRIVCDDLRREI